MRLLITLTFILSSQCFATFLPFPVSSGGSLQRIESVAIASSGSNCQVSQLSSPNWASASGAGPTGVCNVTITGGTIFASAPTCICVTHGTTGVACEVDSTSTTQVVTEAWSTTSPFNGSSTPVYLMCMGPRGQ